MASSRQMIRVLTPPARWRDEVSMRVCGAVFVCVVVVSLCTGCAADGAMDGRPAATPTPAVTASPGARLSGQQFWVTLSVDVRASICAQVRKDPGAALDIAAPYAAANPVFRSQLVATIRSECE